MNNGFLDIKLDKGLISLFIHKPYNFKRDSVNEEEITSEFHELENKINYSFGTIIRPRQTHSNNVKIVTLENINDSFEDTDGLITNLKNVSLCTQVADCQAILFYDPNKKVIGNIHSGWKGTLTRISTNAVNLMVNEFCSNKDDIKVYISPSIHKCHFEVGEDVKEQFQKEFTDIDINSFIIKGEFKEEQKYYIDTVELNKRILNNLGIKEENIISSDLCSVCNDFIHSYRRDKPSDGRNICLIKIKNN